MTRLASPAPYGLLGLPFGATGYPYDPTRPHKGQDWKWRTSDVARSRKVVAPIRGVISKVTDDDSNSQGWGNHVMIWVNSRVSVRLAHAAPNTIRVKVGDIVELNQDLFTMGMTGDVTGIHLHEELLIDGVRVDPELYRAPNGRHLPGTEEDDMPLTEAEMDKIAHKVWAYVSSVTPGGYNMAYLVRDTWSDLTPAITVDGKQVKPDGSVVTLQRRIEENTKAILAQFPVTFTPEQIALIADAISEQVEVPPLSDLDLARIATSVNDEQARRLATPQRPD